MFHFATDIPRAIELDFANGIPPRTHAAAAAQNVANCLEETLKCREARETKTLALTGPHIFSTSERKGIASDRIERAI